MIKSELSPIAIFAYRRVEHLAKTLDALEQCPEFSDSPVFLFSDGPKHSDAAEDVIAVRAFIRSRLRPNMTLVEAPANKGLATSISSAVTGLCDEFGRVIVIEDDLLVSPCTLAWFNAGLQRYENCSQVFQISAHQFVVPEFASRDAGLFLHLTTSWGWATWKRAWDQYDPQVRGWERLRVDPMLRRRFDVGGYPYFDMLSRQMTGQIDSWAIRWWWSVFQANGISLYPPRSLVTNIGFDKTATHLRFAWIRRRAVTATAEMSCPRLPPDATVLEFDDLALARVISRERHPLSMALARVRTLVMARS